MKLRHKYFLSYLFFISLFSMFLVISLLFFFSSQAEKELKNSAEKTFSQTTALLNYQFKQWLYTAYIVSSSNEVQNVQSIPEAEISEEINVQYRESVALRNIINRSVRSLTDVQMRFYIDSSFQNVIDHGLLENLSLLEEYSWYEEFKTDNALTTWQLTSQTQKYSDKVYPALSLFRKVDSKVSKGWISEMYIRQEYLMEILDKADPTGKGMVFLQSDDNVLLSCTDEELYQNYVKINNGLMRRATGEWSEIIMEGREYWMYSGSLNSTGWHLTLLFPADSTGYAPDALFVYMLLMFVVILFISFMAAKLFTQRFSRRLLLLEEKMAALCNGDFNARIEVRGKDEIAQLFDSFNIMSEKTQNLVQQQYENGIRVKNAELNALQAQINPHFLYNTLELINWKAMENDSAEISEISQELALFYRMTLGNGQSMVPLQDEVEHVYHYISIQNFRFAQEVRLNADISEECRSVLIPRLTLQPLVENSILHGFLPQEENAENEKIISIRAVKKGMVLHITIQDNGIGMTSGQIAEILAEKHSDSNKSFGVLNIQQRLQLLYGKEYGLTYSSTEGQGVCVSISIKAE